MADMVHKAVKIAATGTTGTGRNYARGLDTALAVGIEIVAEVVGGTPVLTFTIQGLKLGGDPTVAADWQDVAVVVANSLTAATLAPTIPMSVGRNIFYIDGLDKRFFEGIAVNVTANTNVTYRANAYPNNT
jgi:hypothetical protein